MSSNTVILIVKKSFSVAGIVTRHPDIAKYVPIDFTKSMPTYVEPVEFKAGILGRVQMNQFKTSVKVDAS